MRVRLNATAKDGWSKCYVFGCPKYVRRQETSSLPMPSAQKSDRAKPLQVWRERNSEVFELFLPELAGHLGRDVDDVRRTGILGTEFPYQRVRIYYGGDVATADSVFDFGFAFAVIAPRREAIAVFAQNAGYYVFNHLCIVGLRSSRRSKEKVIWGPSDWWQHLGKKRAAQ